METMRDDRDKFEALLGEEMALEKQRRVRRLDVLKKELGRCLGEVRRNQKMTLDNLSYETGISKGYLSEIENGKKLPSLPTLFHLSEVLEVPLRNFF